MFLVYFIFCLFFSVQFLLSSLNQLCSTENGLNSVISIHYVSTVKCAFVHLKADWNLAPVHTSPENFENSALFLRLSLRGTLKAAKYEIQKPSTCRATLFRCKFSSMFPVFHLARSIWPATKTFVVGWRNAARWLVDWLGHEQICYATRCEFNEKRATKPNLVAQSRPGLYFSHNFLQPATNVFVASQVDHARWKTRNIDENLQRNNVARQVEGFCISYFAALRSRPCWSVFKRKRGCFAPDTAIVHATTPKRRHWKRCFLVWMEKTMLSENGDTTGRQTTRPWVSKMADRRYHVASLLIGMTSSKGV